MEVTLRGNSVVATTTGILLLTRARQLGYPMRVHVIGDPEDVVSLPGPCVVYAPVLASCGVGREAGAGGTVIVPGAPGAPLLVSFTEHGVDGWFALDRTGLGTSEAAKAFVRMGQDARVPPRHLARQLRDFMSALGVAPEPVVLDILELVPADPTTRLSLALRVGRSISRRRGLPITSALTGSGPPTDDPIERPTDLAAVLRALEGGAWTWILDRLTPSLRDPVSDWLDGFVRVAQEDNGRDVALIAALIEVASHVVQLPASAILPPLAAPEDAVAVGVGPALAAVGTADANRTLVDTFRFLGGRYVASGHATLDLGGEPPPEAQIERWAWACRESLRARELMQALWRDIVDPPQ